jgi:hypothetical protein
LNIASTGYDIYNYCQKYEGTNLVKAAGADVAVILGFSIYAFKERKNYNKYIFVGILSMIIGLTLGVLMGTDNLQGFSLLVKILSVLGTFCIGMILLGVGKHISNPEQVSKKSLVLFSIFVGGILLFLLVGS